MDTIKLKHTFKDYINTDFMIEVLNTIISNQENLDTLKRVFNVEEINSVVEFVLCKVIIANHNCNCLTINKIEQTISEKSSSYIEGLAKNVMIQIRIQPYNIQGLENGNFYLEYPFVSPVIVYSNLIINNIANKKDISRSDFKKNEVAYSLIYESCKSVVSSLLLFHLGSYSQAITVYRNLLEQMVKLQILENYPESLKSYLKFCEYNLSYQREETNKEFIREMEEKKVRKGWTQNFLMYGWLDSIEGYNHNYSFKSATELFRDGGKTYKLYEFASRFTHATHIGLNYNWENVKLYFTLNVLSIFKWLAEVYRNYIGGKREVINDVDLYQLMIWGGDYLNNIVKKLGRK